MSGDGNDPNYAPGDSYYINLGDGQIDPDAKNSDGSSKPITFSVPAARPSWLTERLKLTAEQVRAYQPLAPPPPPFNVKSILRWGKAANYSLRQEGGGVVLKKTKSNGNEVDTEISRQVETYRIYNPDDFDTYVDVERIIQIDFKGSDGVKRSYKIKHAPPPNSEQI